ncbi:MAG TPA: hypothetical protein VHM31_08300 [Polyangia bacterium]|nr:hypothetical protein [Polyangia bacterium]
MWGSARHRGAVLAVLLGIGLAAPPAASARRYADAADPVAKVTQMNREALAAIDKREFEKAREILKKALELCDGAGLAQHPIAARTHVHMGVVILEGFKNRELGLKQFSAALAIQPGIGLTPSLATPELTEAFDEARSGAPGGGSAPSEPERPAARAPAAASGGGFTYHTVSEVKQGNPIRVTVNVDDTLKFRKIVLAYRPEGAPQFFGREMEPSGTGAYSAEIPDRATAGASVAYYMEAQDEDGQPVASRGTEERPLVVQLTGGPRPAAPATRQSRPGDGDETGVVAHGQVGGRDEDDQDEAPSNRWFTSLLIGGGFGTTSGHAELNADSAAPGSIAGALLGQLSPEVGYWLGPNLMLSAQGRIQMVTGPTEIDANGRVYSPASWAFALFAKASWFFGSPGGLRPFVSGGLGGGQVRHVVTLDALKDCGPARNQTCVDTVVAGPALAEVGGGVLFEISPAFGIVAGTNLQLAAPQFTANLDLNAGVAFAF